MIKMINKKILWTYLKNYKVKSLFFSNFITIFLILIVPFVLGSFLMYHKMGKNVEREISEINSGDVYRMRAVIDNVVREMEKLAANIGNMPEMQLFLLSKKDELISDDKFLFGGAYQRLYQTINKYGNVYGFINSIYLYASESNFVMSNTNSGLLENFPDKGCYKEYETLKINQSGIEPRKMYDQYPFLITIQMPLYSSYTQITGSVVINIDVEKLSALIESGDDKRAWNISGTSNRKSLTDSYIVDDKGLIIYASNYEMMFQPIQRSPLLTEIINKGEEYSGIVSYGKNLSAGKTPVGNVAAPNLADGRYVAAVTQSQKYKWKYITIIPLEHYQNKLKDLTTTIIQFLMVSLIISFIFAFIISTKSMNPIKRILSVIDTPFINIEDESMHIGMKGNSILPEGKSKIDTYINTNELEYILNNIKSTRNSKQHLEDELENRVKQLDRAQAMALQAQINPHFLFNTLEMINWKAIEIANGKNEASKMLTLLSKQLKSAMEIDHFLIPLSQEIAYAQNYITIMEYRYINMFQVVWDIDEKCMAYKVLKMILQPLFENAIYHGIKPKRSMGEIKVSVMIEGNSMVILIQDNGVGIGVDELKALCEDIDETEVIPEEHIGLKNVNLRIKLIFGAQYGLTIESQKEQRTFIRVRIPLVL